MGPADRSAGNIHSEIGYVLIHSGYEDYKRYQSDHNLNHEQKTQILRNGGLEVVEWSKVVVGDICYVLDD